MSIQTSQYMQNSHSSQMRNENSERMPLSFIPEPQEIIFTDYQPGTIYKQKFCLRNLYSTSCAVKVGLKKSKYFRLESVKRVGKIAPGLEVQYMIHFQPDSSTQSYSNSIIINTEYGDLEVPIISSNSCDLELVPVGHTNVGYSLIEGGTSSLKHHSIAQSSLKQTALQSSMIKNLASSGIPAFSKTGHLLLQQNNITKEIIWDRCPVKSNTSKEIYIRNNSQTDVHFDIATEDPFFIEITDQLTLLGKKTVANDKEESSTHTLTQSVSLRPGEGIQISIVFSPNTRMSDFTSLVRFQYKPSGDIEEIVLRASSEDVNCKLSTTSLTLPSTFIQKINQSTFQLVNNSDTRVKFSWRNLPSVEDERLFIQDTLSMVDETEMYDLRRFDHNELLFNNETFTITPLEGEVWPETEYTFTVDFHPTIEGLHTDVVAWCEVSGREMRLPISLSGNAYGPQVQFSYTSLDVGKVYINSKQKLEIYLENRGKIDADFELLPFHSLFSSTFYFSPNSGTIKAGDVQLIKISFQPDLIGEFSETFQWRISGSAEPLQLHYSGEVIGPSFAFDCSKIDFGIVSYNFVTTRFINLSNTSDIPMKFKLRIPGDGSLMGREFDVVPQNGTIIPHTTKQIRVDLLSNSIKEYQANLTLDIEDVGEEVMTIPIHATCIVPEVNLSAGSINFGECFITYPYHQHLELANMNDQPAKYEIIPPPENKSKLSFVIENLKGVIPSNSNHKVRISINCVTPGSHFFPLYVRILGSDRPPFEVSVQATGVGPIVTADVKKVEFGRISVLKDFQQSVTLTNKSPIPAKVNLSTKSSVFKCTPSELDIDPESSVEVIVIANVDDALKFTDELLVDVEKSGKFKVRLEAAGRGTSLLPSIELKELDFGNQFTKRTCQISFEIENKGRKAQQIQWQIPYKKKKPGDDTPPELEIFKIIPDRAQIEPKSIEKFVVEGYSEEVGEFEQLLQCKIVREKDNIFEVKVHCCFTLPLLRFSEKKLSFDYIHNSRRAPAIQSQPLTLKNVSPIDLDIIVKPYPEDAFSLQQSTYLIPSGESATVNVLFDPSYRQDLISHNLKQKLVVTYAKHPQKDSIELLGSISFPNVKLETTDVDFGSVLNFNEKHKYVKMMNESKAVCYYSWIFDVAQDSNVRYNDYFDIIPTEGVLQPGEVQNLQFIFRGGVDESYLTQAICKVEGGPDYYVQLKAEASSISYSISSRDIDFGSFAYDVIQNKEIILYNKGKVPFQFIFNVPATDSTSIDFHPSTGVVAGESSCPITISLFACVPDEVVKKIFLTVDNYDPEELVIKALPVYPSISLNLSRKETVEFLTATSTLKEYNQNDFSYSNKVLQLHSSNDQESLDSIVQLPLSEQQRVSTEAERILYSAYLSEHPFSQRRLVTEIEQDNLYKSKKTQKKEIIPDDPAVDPNFILTTYICDFGNLVKGLSKKMSFSITNTGFLPVSFSFDKKICTKLGFTPKPLLINHLPGYPNNESQTIEILFNSKPKYIEVGSFCQQIPLRIHNGPIINIEARANIILPDLQISSQLLDFGRLYISRCRFITIQLFNAQPTACEYILEHSSSSQDPIHFIVASPSGVLEPNECRNVEVQFIPTHEKQYHATLLLKCTNNPNFQSITCCGEGKELDICINPEELEMPPVLPHINSLQQISLVNNSDIDVEIFSFDYDTKYIEELEILKSFNSSSAILIDPRKVGEGLPHWITDEIEKQSETENEQEVVPMEVTAPEVSVSSSMKMKKSNRKMFACIYGPPLSGKTAVSRELSIGLNIPVVTVEMMLEGESSASQSMIQEWITSAAQNDEIYPNGFIIDGLRTPKLRALEVAEAIVAGIGENMIYFVTLTVDELELKLRHQIQRENELLEELNKISQEELDEDAFLSLNQEERIQYQKAIRSVRSTRKSLDQVQKMKASLQHHRSTINKEIEDIVPVLLEEQKQEQNQSKKVAKGKNDIPSEGPYQILETDDELTKEIKLFKQSFAAIFNFFQNPNGISQEKAKKNSAPQVMDVQRSFYFNIDCSLEDIVDSILTTIPDLFPEEIENVEDVVSLPIPEPYTKQLLPITDYNYAKRSKLEFTLWDIKEIVPEPKDQKAKKGKKEDESPQQEKISASRWIIPSHSKAVVWVQFSSENTGVFTSMLNFGVVGRELQYTLKCKGTVGYPQISNLPKTIFSNCVKNPPSSKKLPSKKFFLSTNTYEFGPLLIRNDYSQPDSLYTEDITLTNSGMFDAHVELGVKSTTDENNSFKFIPSVLDLKPFESSKVTIQVAPTTVGDIRNTVVCCIRNNPIPVSFDLHAIGASPLIDIDTPVVDFGKLLLTDKPTARKITLTNTSTVPVVWKFENLDKISSEFTITPTEGSLKYQGSEDVTIIFKTEKACISQGTLILKVSDENNLVHAEDKKIEIKSEAYDLKIDMDTSLDLGTVKVVDTITKGINMENKGKYDVKYKWMIPKSLSKHFSIGPEEGVLAGELTQGGGKKKPPKPAASKKKGQSDEPEGTVLLTFTTNKPVTFKNNSSIKILFFETEHDEKIGEISFNVSVNSIYSKYVVTPVHGLNFGPLIYGKEKVKEFEISNPGTFDISFTIEEKGPTRPPTAQAVHSQANTKKLQAKKDPKGKELEGLKVGAFTLSPKEGVVTPGSKAIVKVTFNSEGHGLHREVVQIKIPDTKPLENTLEFDVQGESCVPGMNTNDVYSIFEEQQIVNSLSALTPGESAYAIDEQVFTFGTVSSHTNVFESIRISNPFKVPCNISLSVQPRDKNDVASAKSFEVQPTSLFIPPHEHRYAKIYFSPQALQCYSAIFEAITKDGSDSSTNRLKFEIRGEGSLPQITLDQPTNRDASNNALLKFPRTLLGRSTTLPVVIRNDGVIATSCKFEFSGHPSLQFSDTGNALVLQPGEVKSFSMVFNPTSPEKIDCHLKLLVPDNHFEDTTIHIQAESYSEEITFEDLPNGEFDIIKLGDCPISSDKFVTFIMQNHSGDHMRFDWTSSEYFKIVPRFGHVHAKSQKEISISLKTSQPKEVKGEKIKLATKKIKYLKSELLDWDDTHRTVRWIDVEEVKESIETKGKKQPSKIPAETQDPPKMINKRVEEVDPEPKHEIIGQEVLRELQVEGRADYAKYTLLDIENDVTFAETQMFTQRQIVFSLKNSGSVSLSYNWDFTEYEESAFSISPAKGTVERNASQSFTLTFAPTDVSEHDEVLICHIPNLDVALKTPRIVLRGTSSCPVVHFELTPSDYITSDRRDPELPGPDGKYGELDSKTKVVELESCGIRIKNSKRFFILNPTSSSYKYQWRRISDPQETSMFECSSTKGIIHSGKKTEVCFEFVPNSLDVKECFWMFSIPERDIHVPFLTVGHANEPQLYFDQPRINFKRVLVGAVATSTLKLVNREEIPFSYSFEKSKFRSPNDPQGPVLISISPSTGTIGPKQEIQVEVKFKPLKEEFYNFNLVCRVKRKPNTLTCNVKGEGFSVHEHLEFGDSHQHITSSKINNLDFGKVQINDKQVKTIVLYNNGDYNYDFSWQRQRNPYVTIIPETGTVEKRGKVICNVAFHPTKAISLLNYKTICNITNGREYTVTMNGVGVQPKIQFSFKSYNFGPRFLHHQGARPNECFLKITNEDDRDISYDLDFESTPHLDVQGSSTLLRAGESSKIRCVFMPREYKKYQETIIFHVNGLFKVPVVIEGEGTPAKVELFSESPRNASFGALRVGESSSQTLVLINKSKIPTTIYFPRDQEQLRKNFVSIDMKDAVQIQPKEKLNVTVLFQPLARLQSFNENLYAIIEGKEQSICNVLGSCQGIEVKLNPQNVSFGMVVQNTVVSQKVILENNGDIGINFHWNKKHIGSDITIIPTQGYIPPNEDLVLDVTFAPKKIKSVKYENIECKIEQSPSVFMTVTGTCVNKPEQKEILTFKCPVRQKDTKTIEIENPTQETWMLKPTIDSTSWKGDDFLEIPARGKVTYSITYAPLRSSKFKKNSLDEATLFFPLPNGTALLYSLRGESSEPLPSGELVSKFYAKSIKVHSASVENWLPQAQRFHVTFDFNSIQSPDYIKGVEYFDVPAHGKKTFKFSVEIFKPGQFVGKVLFTNKETGEYCFYNCKFDVEAPQIIEKIHLETPVRQNVSRSISIENPLDEEIVISIHCPSQDVVVPQEVALQPKLSSKIDISYLPLVATKESQEVQLILKSSHLGEYPYTLVLSALPSGPEKNIHFSVALGNSQVQTLRFKNLCRVATEYTISFEEKDQQMFMLVDKPLIKAAAAESAQGNEISFDVHFEPGQLGKFKSKLNISSKQGGDYSFLLFGHCTAPRPQGPIEIAPNGTAQVPFKNVFGDAKQKTDFRIYVDNPAFSVKPDNLSVAGKQKGNVAVSFKPVKVGEVAHGKVVIEKKDDPKLKWIYYLLGLAQAPPKGK